MLTQLKVRVTYLKGRNQHFFSIIPIKFLIFFFFFYLNPKSYLKRIKILEEIIKKRNNKKTIRNKWLQECLEKQGRI